jgi:gluconolactonase
MRVLAALLGVVLCSAPALAQSLATAPVEKIAGGFRFTEGPAWSREGFLVFSDIQGDRLHRFTPGVGVSVIADNVGHPNGNTFDADGRLYTCQGLNRRVVRTTRDGRMEVLADRFEGKRFNAPNDIVVRRDGQVYFTDPSFGRRTQQRELDFHGVYHLAADGRLEAVARWTTRPNGVALSPDGRVLYVADSDARLVRAYDLDAAGRAGNERVVVEGITGVPDGLRIDVQGNLYVAAREVYAFAPTGRLLGVLALPETPANLAFGGSDLNTLFVTARTGLYRVSLGVRGALQY